MNPYGEATSVPIGARAAAGRPWWIAVIAGVAVILAAGAGIIALRWLLTVKTVAPPDRCVERAALTPQRRSGPPWQQGRHWLEAPASFEGARGTYVVINERTGQAFWWGELRPRGGGSIRFPVPTRYASVHNRGWRADPWAFCSVPPGWQPRFLRPLRGGFAPPGET